jgi:ABC-type tungstate transport system permease subunit
LTARGLVDCALTYERDQGAYRSCRWTSSETTTEDAYIGCGELVRLGTLFLDRFVLCGPETLGVEDEVAAFQALAADPDAVFFSRHDGSATHCKENEIWAAAGLGTSLALWRSDDYREESKPVAMRYERRQVFPVDALRLVRRAALLSCWAKRAQANELRAYTLIDYGTWCKVSAAGEAPNLRVCVDGGHRLVNPCCILTRPSHPCIPVMRAFLASDALQRSVDGFRPAGVQLFRSVGDGGLPGLCPL